MNTIDSIEMNEELVILWNGIEERAEDQEVIDYAKGKRKQLTELLESKKLSDKNKKDFDRQYMMLIDKEIREVNRYVSKHRWEFTYGEPRAKEKNKQSIRTTGRE